MIISGMVGGHEPHSLEYSYDGSVFEQVTTNSLRVFSFTKTLSSGQGDLIVRWADDHSQSATNNIGVGDIFLIAGQSNASGRGDNNQVAAHASLQSKLFGNNYQWSNLTDPTDTAVGQVDSVSLDSLYAGSVWPLIANHYMDDEGAPIVFVPCSKGGATVTDWQPGTNHQDRATLYGSMVYRGLAAGGAKGVLWWQGESDAFNEMSQGDYYTALTNISAAISTDLGCKLIPCKLQTITSATQPAQDAINAAIGQAWADDPNTLQGPDLTGIASDDATHLKTNAKLSQAAALWWTAIKTDYGW